MPRKQVYGKRSTAASFISTFATFSSPAKPDLQTSKGSEVVLEVTRKLKTLSVARKSGKEFVKHDGRQDGLQAKQSAAKGSVKSKTSNVLASRDVNVIPMQQRENGNLGKENAPTVRHEKLLVKVAAVEVVEPRASIALGQKQNRIGGSVKEMTPQKPKARPGLPARSKVSPSYMSPTVQSCARAVRPFTESPGYGHPKSARQGRTASQRPSALSCRTNINRDFDHFTAHALPLLSLCSDPVGSSQPTDFQSWADSLSPFFRISKIAEASYGEVYRLSLLSHKSGFTRSDESVLKVIALKPPPPLDPGAMCENPRARAALEKKTAFMSKVEDVAGEVQLLQRMSPIPGFTNFREIRVMNGHLPKQFLAAWRAFNRTAREKSQFPDPARKTSYPKDQLWAVIEMQDAGTDLENVAVGNVWLCWDIFWSVAITVAKGEELAEFEHRDLHPGNICIRSSNPDIAINGYRPPTLRPGQKFNFSDVETTIIDYTLSRAQMDDPDGSRDREKRIAYFDLENDPAVFEGDAREEYQYEIYRFMRGAMYLDDPMANVERRWIEAKATERTWRQHHPQTNIVWLHFLLHKLTEHLVWPSEHPAIYTESHGAGIGNDPLLVATRLGVILKKLQDLLDPAAFQKSGLRSAKDLLALAMCEGWLNAEDVVECSGTAKAAKAIAATAMKGPRRRKQ